MTVIKVAFTWPHPAQHVQLAGSFNSWQPADMHPEPDHQVWRLEVDVECDLEHQYKFVVDGEWMHDAEKPSMLNEVGSSNNVICVSSPVSPTKIRDMIEVERKFSVPDDFRQILPDHGFHLVKEFEETLVDDYYDTPTFDLLRRDHWLRRRNDDWELKYPVGNHQQDPNSTSPPPAVYHESSDAESIMIQLKSLRVDAIEGVTSLKDLSTNGSIVTFAHLVTRRCCYKRDEVSIVVDDTDWGFRVGEIEVVVSSKDQVPWATRRIQEVAKALDFGPYDGLKAAKSLL